MKFIGKIMRMLIVGIMSVTTIAAANINAFASEQTWQEAYLELIKESQNDSSAYLLHYIDDDEIPELYMWDNQYQCYALYTYNGNEPVQCSTWGNKESIWFYSDRNGYFWSTYTTNASYQYNVFHELKAGLCNDVYSFCIDRSEMPTEKYLINDEDVGKEEYERKMTELESEYPLSIDFQINGTLNQTYDEIRQYLLNSMKSENNSEIDEPITTETAETIQEISTSESIDYEETKVTTEQTTEVAKIIQEIASAETIDNADKKNTTTINAKHSPSPKTGDSKPFFCELIIIGFISISIIALLRKRYNNKNYR